MDLLTADNVTYRFRGRDLLSRVSFTLRSGERLGLVGRNSAGKTTLLGLLAGTSRPGEGRVVKAPGVRLGLQPRLTQGTVAQAERRALAHVRALETALREMERQLATQDADLLTRTLEDYARLTERFEAAGGYEAEVKLRQTLARFGFEPGDGSRRVTTLSGGERAKLSLALALTNQPDVLLLDEPSSHLDLAARRTLADTLKAYPGALLFASHDRALLDAVCTHIAHLHSGQLIRYKGTYESFKQTQGLAARSAQKRAQARDKEVAALTTSAARLRGWGTPNAARQRRAVEKRLERLYKEPVAPPRADASKTLSLEAQKARGVLLEATHLSKRYEVIPEEVQIEEVSPREDSFGEVSAQEVDVAVDAEEVKLAENGLEEVVAERTILEDATLRVYAGDKLALVGPNGAGKSTLLKLLTGALTSDHPEGSLHFGKGTKVAVFDQDTRGLVAETSLLDQLGRYVSEPRARMLLALVGLEGKADARPETLSEGQKARAGVALIASSEANLLFLDEPTENLDIETIERLERALEDTDAAFVLVSHDAALVERVATRVLSLEAGEIKEFRGGLGGYFRGALRLEPDLPAFQSEPVERSAEETLERFELERLELDERRLDAYRLSERERARLERRYADLLNDLFALYETRHFAAAPLHERREGAVRVSADSAENGYLFTSNAGLDVKLLGHGEPRLGHLAVIQREGLCTLPWARDAALRLVVRLAFEHLGLQALQVQSEDDLHAAGFGASDDDWWVLSRSRYEVAQGYA